jgi:hypothetical protein
VRTSAALLIILLVGGIGASLYVYSTAFQGTQVQASNYVPVTSAPVTYTVNGTTHQVDGVTFYSWVNANNSAKFISDTSSGCGPATPSLNLTTSKDFFCSKMTVVITHQEQDAANVNLLNEGFTASCIVGCHGVTYSSDPTAIMTNDGHDFMFNCKDLGAAAVITCVSTDFANYWLLSSASSLAVTDAACPATTITSGGLYYNTAIVPTVGTPSLGTVTSTEVHTYTAAETDSAVAALCIDSEASAGSHLYSVYEFSFGPDTLVSGNTIAITATLTAT